MPTNFGTWTKWHRSFLYLFYWKLKSIENYVHFCRRTMNRRFSLFGRISYLVKAHFGIYCVWLWRIMWILLHRFSIHKWTCTVCVGNGMPSADTPPTLSYKTKVEEREGANGKKNRSENLWPNIPAEWHTLEHSPMADRLRWNKNLSHIFIWMAAVNAYEDTTAKQAHKYW